MASSTPRALQVTSARTGSEIMGEGQQEADPVLVIRNLLLTAIHSINYIRGLFHEDCFSDKSVPALEMKVKMLMPMDPQSSKLIDWMEKGVCHALEKKYLKTFLFCIFEGDLIIEEYTFSFRYSSTSTDETVMTMRTEKGSTSFKSNASQVTPHQMRSSACKMIRSLVSLMRTLDPMPEERTILMKLLYYDDITPRDYEPPVVKICDDNDTISTWNRNAMKLEDANRKHLVLVLKVKNTLHPYNDNNVTDIVDGLSLNDESDYNYFSNIEPSKRRSGCVLVSSSKKIEFILDSGATHHICNDKSIMCNLKHIKEEDQVSVYCCGGTELKAEMMGSVLTKNFELSQVGFIPTMAFNVVSVGQLASQGLLTNIADRQFSVISLEDARMVGEGFLQKKNDRLNGTESYEYVFRTMTWDVQGDDETLLAAIHDDENLEEGEEWTIGTGCGRHMVPDLNILINPKHHKVPLQSASGTIWATHKGSVKEGKLFLKDVLYCQKLERKLMSVAMLDMSGHRITFNAERCAIVHKDGLDLKGVGLLEKNTRLYLLKADEEENKAAVKEEKNLVVAEKEDVLMDSEGKIDSMMAEEDNESTDLAVYTERMNESEATEAEQCGLTNNTKDKKNKRVATEEKGKAAKRIKRQKLRIDSLNKQ